MPGNLSTQLRRQARGVFIQASHHMADKHGDSPLAPYLQEALRRYEKEHELRISK